MSFNFYKFNNCPSVISKYTYTYSIHKIKLKTAIIIKDANIALSKSGG